MRGPLFSSIPDNSANSLALSSVENVELEAEKRRFHKEMIYLLTINSRNQATLWTTKKYRWSFSVNMPRCPTVPPAPPFISRFLDRRSSSRDREGVGERTDGEPALPPADAIEGERSSAVPQTKKWCHNDVMMMSSRCKQYVRMNSIIVARSVGDQLFFK